MEQTKKEESIKAASKREEPVMSAYSFEEIDLPEVIEKPYEDFVTYGQDNLFPQRLIVAWLQSPIHNAITTGISQMIAGEGVQFDHMIPEVERWIKRVNRAGDSLDDLINKTAADLYLHGYYGWQVIWNQARTEIVSIYHTPAEQIRAGKADEDGVVNEYYISWDWSQYRKKKFNPEVIPAWDPTDRTAPKQMMFVRQYRPSQYYYSTPSYIGGMNWIIMDNMVGEFHLNGLENGFFPSAVVQFFNGDPPPEQKRAIEANFMKKFTGKKQAKVVFVYNNNRDQAVQFDTYEGANIDKRFKELMPEIAKNIMIAHRVPSPLLFGIRDSTGLGNNAEELESSSLLLNKMVVMPLQKIILQSLGQILKINGWKTEATIETSQPSQWLEGEKSDAESTTEEQPEVTVTAPTGEKRELTPDDIPAEVLPQDIQKTALNGAQISSLLEVIENVTTGRLSKESAKAIISASFPTFTPEQVDEVVNNIVVKGPEVAEFVAQRVADREDDHREVLTDDMAGDALKILKKVGEKREDLEADGWILVQDGEDMTQAGKDLNLEKMAFNAKISSDPDAKSRLDTGLYKLRYDYKGPQDSKNRTFCGEMMAADLIYRKEDISQMSFKTANPEFGTYSIFNYKGSYNCRHRWNRLVFFRERTKSGTFKPEDGLDNDRKVAKSRYPEVKNPADTEATKVNDKVKK